MATADQTADLEAVLDELRALRATVDQQQSELDQLRTATPARTNGDTGSTDTGGTVSSIPARGPVSRRAAMLGLTGAGVAGITMLGSAAPAAAADGDTVLVGGEYDATSVTKLTNSSATDAAVHGVTTATGVAIAGPANAIKGETTGADNGAHTVLGVTAGTGHAVAGVTTNSANAVATTWGRGNHNGAAVEGEQINTEGIALAGPGNAVKGIIYTGSKGDPQPSDNHSHANLGVTYGGGHAVAGVTPASAKAHDDDGSNKVASTWGRHSGQGAAVEGEQNTAETVALAGNANAVAGIIYTGSKSAPEKSLNSSHAVQGVTYGGGHAVAGVTPAGAINPDDTGSNQVASTWGKHFGRGAAVEGEQNTAETVELAGSANAVKGIIYGGSKSDPQPSSNGSHALLGITYGAGHSVAGDTPDGVGNTVASTWGRHKGDGAGIGGVSVRGYGGEFVGGKASVRLIPNDGSDGAPSTGDHLPGELFMDDNGKLYLCTEGGTPGTFVLLNTKGGGDGPTLLPTPERAVDNVSFAAGETMTFDLSETSMPDTARSAIVTVTVLPTSNAGYVSLYSADQTITGNPSFTSLNWGGGGSRKPETNTTTVAVADGEIKVFAVNTARVYIDVVGYHDEPELLPWMLDL